MFLPDHPPIHRPKGPKALLLTFAPSAPAVELAHRRSHHGHSAHYATVYDRGDSNPHLADGSYYGANGPLFCAAPRSVPLGTVLRIHSPTTGRTIRVVVRDRCPDHVDLSRGAFNRLGAPRGEGHIAIETAVESHSHKAGHAKRRKRR